MPDEPDQQQKPTERLPKSGVRVPVPEREDVMAALRKVSKPEPDEDSEEQHDEDHA
ncbi:MAG TPA: hypothetical protein VN618_01405 [Solirubrobacteraceae bacterium]|nr:hypothetical protein [Solirubrobacteraceae bacterium]